MTTTPTELEGPQPMPQEFTCTGCKHLSTEDWEFYGENDEFYGENNEIDRGTNAKCLKAGKHIASYWYSGYRPPSWCPFAPAPTSPAGIDTRITA